MLCYRLGAPHPLRASTLSVLPSNVLHVPGTPGGAPLRGHASHTSHTPGRAARREYSLVYIIHISLNP